MLHFVQALERTVQAAFNLSLLEEGVPSAWVDALAALRERFVNPIGGTLRPCQTLYGAVPDTPPLPEAPTAEQHDACLAAFVASKASLITCITSTLLCWLMVIARLHAYVVPYPELRVFLWLLNCACVM